MSDNLQRMPPIGVDWEAPEPSVRTLVTLTIGVPDHAKVRRNTHTGVIEIDDITIEDLIGFRDSVSEQIIELQEGDGWETL